MLKWSLVFCSVVAVSLAAQAIGPLPEKPAKFKDVEGCFIEELDTVIPFGQSMPAKIGNCMEFTCRTNNIVYTSCGSVVADPPLVVRSDLTKPYPACCPKFEFPRTHDLMK